jgi:hypothetical protein
MEATGLNGKVYRIDLKKFSKKRSKCSSHHSEARRILQDLFNGYLICEEVKLPGCVNPAKRAALFLDFLVPSFDLAIEVHGRQHFEFVPYFHKSKSGFLEHKYRDSCKANWCELNGLVLVVLRFDQTEDDWVKLIKHAVLDPKQGN